MLIFCYFENIQDMEIIESYAESISHSKNYFGSAPMIIRNFKC